MAEPELQAMLGNDGVNLIFQLPYNPDFNSCEFCFRNKKNVFAKAQTEIAIFVIFEGLQTITEEMSTKFFQHVAS